MLGASEQWAFTPTSPCWYFKCPRIIHIQLETEHISQNPVPQLNKTLTFTRLRISSYFSGMELAASLCWAMKPGRFLLAHSTCDRNPRSPTSPSSRAPDTSHQYLLLKFPVHENTPKSWLIVLIIGEGRKRSKMPDSDPKNLAEQRGPTFL